MEDRLRSSVFVVPSSVVRRPSICKLSANAIDSIEILTIHSGTSRFGSLGHAVPKCDGQIVLAVSVVHSMNRPEVTYEKPLTPVGCLRCRVVLLARDRRRRQWILHC